LSGEKVVYPGAVIPAVALDMKREKCPQCGSTNITKSARKWECNDCGRKSLSWNLKKCPKCGMSISKEDNFCMECGAEVPNPKPASKMKRVGEFNAVPLGL
jgi:ribosomal protein L37E